ncbi:MAG: hypothetical protein ABR574_01500 [Cryomorphaceae bacterium]
MIAVHRIYSNQLFALLACAIALSACKSDTPEESDVVVRVYNEYLLKDELADKMPRSYSAEDSASIADQIVNNWVRQTAVVKFAEQHLTEEQKDFSQQLEDYRNSLVTYAYERELINQKLDTIVDDAEIQDYYDENIQNFKLRSYIVKLRFIKMSPDAPKLKKVESWFMSDEPDDFDKLYDYCRKYAENFYFKDENWLYLEEFLKEVPIDESDWNNFLKNTTYLKFESGAYLYLIRIYDYRLKDDRSPMALELDGIKELILNKRKVELINQMREDVVTEAREEGNIEIPQK